LQYIARHVGIGSACVDRYTLVPFTDVLVPCLQFKISDGILTILIL